MIINDILGNNHEMDCIGCAIADGSFVPIGGLIKETENFVLVHDPEVPIKGFLVINSKRYIKSITQLTKQQAAELFELCYKARTALLTFDDIIECTLIQEERSGHFHFWILPRYAWMDGLFKNSLSTIREMMRYAAENYKTDNNINEIKSCIDKLKQILCYCVHK